MIQLDYLDLELAIRGSAQTGYLVTVLHSPQGEAQTAITWPWPAAEFEQTLTSIQHGLLQTEQSLRDQTGRVLGETLFRAVFSGEVGLCFEASKSTARSQGKGLRLKLRIEAVEWMAAPWELLYDPRMAEFVALSRQTPLVRYLAVPQPIQPLAIRPPLRILGVAASPAGLPALDVVQEQRQLAAALAPLVSRGQAELVWLPGQQGRDLQAALQGGPWHIVHFIGHALYDQGQQEGVLLLSGEDGAPQPLTASQFARLIADLPELRLVVLNACEGARGEEQRAFSSLAATLVRRGLPAVIAMQYAISDRAALEFAGGFYGALAAALPIDAATGEARKAMSLAAVESLAWSAPALFLRAPDGRLWSLPLENSDRPHAVGSSAALPVAPRAEPQVNANIQIGGSAIGSTIVVGTNAQAAAAGGAPSQAFSAEDTGWFEQQGAQLLFALTTLRGRVEGMRLSMAELQLKLLQGELTKSAQGQRPAAEAIMSSVEWLLAHVPDLSVPLLRFLKAPATRRVIDQAGKETAEWARRRLT